MRQFSRYQVATSIAVLFHVVGLAGLFFFKETGFVNTTPLHLLLMAGLLFYTQEKISFSLLLFFVACFVTGIAAEILGTSTGHRFGNYQYGTVLGPGFKNVPYFSKSFKKVTSLTPGEYKKRNDLVYEIK